MEAVVARQPSTIVHEVNAFTIAGCENGFLFVDGDNPMFAPRLRPGLGL